ncbi:hypothetical protein [Amycolatopsis sp. PS_44_ISF1]|uniref:hypothetical protein n=1 Tax=Amycolatopsis sp. PS_44_ISF1 TaxID=2974917 RepID=UPI0028DF9607|nr:hypothetical protein [Amycolatopsis sp. PS_44_ISF1]MDT8912352.1 hypothetical protein [Amycolatopsis sp. PS_44_ISF1]
MRFANLRAEGRSHVVVNTVDATAGGWKQLAVAVCGEGTGLFAHRLAVLSHRGRGTFDLRCFRPDGSAGEPDVPLLACAARAVQRRYGYRRTLLRSSGRVHLAELTGDSVSVRPWPEDAPPGVPVPVTYLFDGELLP